MSRLNIKYNLHRQNTLMLILIALFSSLIYFAFILTIVDRLQQTMLATLVGHEVDEIITELATDPNLVLPRTATVNAYLLSREQDVPIPDYLKELGSTLHNEVKLGEKTFHVIIVDINKDRLYLSFEISEIIKYRFLLLISVIGGGLLAVIFLLFSGIWLSKKFLLPVSELAIEVANINPNDRNIRIENKYRDFEVGLIANSVDQFMVKMDDYVEREQSFTAAISHELRTPVSVISTSIDLLELRGISKTQQQAFERIKSSVNYMGKVIESLLFFARNIHEKPEDVLTGIELSGVCEDVINQYDVTATRKNLSLLFEIKSNTEVLMSDNHIEIILGNLVRNAINNTDFGSVKITVLDNGFSVSDTGHGIAAEDIQHILDRCNHRPHSNVSGLGLYLVTHICKYYNLHLDIDSTVGKGSNFLVKFPEKLLV